MWNENHKIAIYITILECAMKVNIWRNEWPIYAYFIEGECVLKGFN